MADSALDIAKYLLKQRKFEQTIRLLESHADLYDGVFEYYVTCGIAYLYADVAGSATRCFTKARGIKVNNTDLLLGQAAIFLRHGETDRAIEYYLNVLDFDPNNKTAKSALEFIQKNGDYSTIVKYVDTGEIKKYYPPLGVNPLHVRNCILGGLFLGAVLSVFVAVNPLKLGVEPRYTGGQLELSDDEIEHPLDATSTVAKSYVLRAKDVRYSFDAAKSLFADSRDNAAQVEVNRIVLSNAIPSIKMKASSMEKLFKEPTFDSLKDNYSFKEVCADPTLYANCYVIWDGSVSDGYEIEGGKWQCDLLVDYIPSQGQSFLSGNARVIFDSLPDSGIDTSRPARILGKIIISGPQAFYVSARGLYQPLKGKVLK